MTAAPESAAGDDVDATPLDDAAQPGEHLLWQRWTDAGDESAGGVGDRDVQS